METTAANDSCVCPVIGKTKSDSQRNVIGHDSFTEKSTAAGKTEE